MHCVFEFPLVDCRPLLAGYNGKLSDPEWAGLSPNSKSFIRHFGAVKGRKAGGSLDWQAEDYFCNSHLSMKYTDLHKQGFAVQPGVRSAIYNSYRRYFSDGYFVGKIEAGFVDNTEKKASGADLEENSINLGDIIAHYADITVNIHGEESKIYKAGPKLAARYHEESTVEKMQPGEQQKLVVAGEIAIVLVYTAGAAFKLPENTFLLQQIPLPGDAGALQLYGCKLRHEAYVLKVWLIETPQKPADLSKDARELLRNLRINLLRIHLEKETLRILLNNIKNNKIPLKENSKEATLANSYFKKTAEKLFRKERFTLDQKNLLDFALHSEETVAPGSFSSLEESVYYFQDKFTRDNIEKLLTGMAPKTVLFICTSPMDINPLDFGEEFRQIKNSLRRGTDRNNYKIEIETAVRKNEFSGLLDLYKPDYLHLSMHGSLKNGLCFQNDSKEICPMAVDEFSAILQQYSNGQQAMVVILSACNSQPHAKAAKNYCRFAVGTQTAFPADAGVIYAAKFYASLVSAANMDIPKCHEEAIKAVHDFLPQWEPINDLPVYEIIVLN